MFWVAHASRVLAMVSRYRRLCSQASSYRRRLFRRDPETNTRDACATRSAAAMRERIEMVPAGCRQLQASSLRSPELRSGRFGEPPLLSGEFGVANKAPIKFFVALR